MGKGGKAQSRFDERGSGDGRPRGRGAVALRRGFPKGDRDPSFGVKGERLRDGEELTGVSCSCGKNGRSTERSALAIFLSMPGNVLAADVSTLGGIALPGLRNPGPFVGVFLKGILSKLPYESGGGVAAEVYQYQCFNISQKTYVHHLHIHDLPSGRSRYPLHTWNILSSAESSTLFQSPPSSSNNSVFQTRSYSGLLLRRHTLRPEDTSAVKRLNRYDEPTSAGYGSVSCLSFPSGV